MRKHHRRSIRLPEYDYSQVGAYFVTICVHGRENRLGTVENGQMQLKPIGHIARDAWVWLDRKFTAVGVDIYCIMPNHVHAILAITDPGGVLQNAPTNAPSKTNPPTKPKPLGRLVGAYKTHSTVLINQTLGTPGIKFWQRTYYERIIRNQREYEAIWHYIETNPQNWPEDQDFNAEFD